MGKIIRYFADFFRKGEAGVTQNPHTHTPQKKHILFMRPKVGRPPFQVFLVQKHNFSPIYLFIALFGPF